MRILLTQLVVLLVLFSSANTSSDKVLISEVEFANGLYKFDDRLITGEIIDYYENETLKFRYRVLEGRLHGLATEFFSDGSVKSERNYTFSKLFGSLKEYYPNGDVKLQFQVGLNAYGSGEKVTKLEIASGSKHKLKSKDDCVIHFIGADNKPLDTSENISILSQSKYKLLDKKGKVVFEN
ncbi:toxin-antitoxin system YwqK family antitoxin [Roseivirga sp. E12]|uniref:toxin-antitoxin system YwqK family antitoxin n=1 Tax=Roseivirga sp. E12 TaxID=2819237 RepID=UPI001ABC024C|nr:hypothetical protein [Roseivirga sp. E12]MBO3700461.1 hypothetical protein [Roseivirga sp. E12]